MSSRSKEIEIWNRIPNSVDEYFSELLKQREALQREFESYVNSGCVFLSKEIERLISKYDNYISNTYRGFYSIDLLSAKLLIAKINGLSIAEQNFSYKVKDIPFDFWGETGFYPDYDWRINEVPENILFDIANFPELAIENFSFDSVLALAPYSLYPAFPKENLYSFKMPNGEMYYNRKIHSARRRLSLHLIECKLFKYMIIGTIKGKHYLIKVCDGI